MVSVTLVVLPLATLLALQLKFLAYQAEGITWAQRVAVFWMWDFWLCCGRRSCTEAMIGKRGGVKRLLRICPKAGLAGDDRAGGQRGAYPVRGHARPVRCRVNLRRDGAPIVDRARWWLFRRAIAPRHLLLVVLFGLLAVLWALIWGSESSLPSIQPVIPVALFLAALPLAFFWHPTAPRGSLALLSASILAPLLTLGLMVDGEFSETAVAELQKPLLDWQMLDQTRHK